MVGPAADGEKRMDRSPREVVCTLSAKQSAVPFKILCMVFGFGFDARRQPSYGIKVYEYDKGCVAQDIH